MSQPFPPCLSTARLRLRPLLPGDALALCRYRALPEVSRYQTWKSFGPEDAARLIEGQRDAQPDEPGTWFQLAIIETATGAMIGDCGLHCLSLEETELGITLAPVHQGRGYAAEALAAVIVCLFGPLGMHRVSAITDAENHASAALFQRLGFRRETHFIDHVWCRESWGSEYGFALSRREWELRPARDQGDRSAQQTPRSVP